MSSTVGFACFLALTVVLLGLDVWTGRGGRRRAHLTLVASTFVSLGLAIYWAERLGHEYDLEAAGAIYPIHLAVAKTATLAYLAPVVTGIRLLAGRGSRRAHHRAAYVALALTLVTALTGITMILMAEPHPPVAVGAPGQ